MLMTHHPMPIFLVFISQPHKVFLILMPQYKSQAAFNQLLSNFLIKTSFLNFLDTQPLLPLRIGQFGSTELFIS